MRGPGKEIPAVKDKSPKKMTTFIWSLQAPSEAKTKATLGLAEDACSLRKLKGLISKAVFQSTRFFIHAFGLKITGLLNLPKDPRNFKN